MMWIITAIGILIIIFLIFIKAIDHNKCDNIIDNGNKIPQIDINSVKNIITPVRDNATFRVNKQEETSDNNNEDVKLKNDGIIWTAELTHIKSIMFLAPTHTKKTPRLKSSKQRQYYEKQESLTSIEEYELAVWFAELIEEADNLHKAKMFAEERAYCLNAIKWCARSGLSIIYWQNRLNQINELLGINPIEVAGKSNDKIKTDKKYLSASDKYEWFKSFTEPLETEYQTHHANKDITAEQIVVKKAIKWARENNLIYYQQKWEKRIVKTTSKTESSIEQKLKEKKRQRHTYDITPTKKKRRPRIPYSPKNKGEEE